MAEHEESEFQKDIKSLEEDASNFYNSVKETVEDDWTIARHDTLRFGAALVLQNLALHMNVDEIQKPAELKRILFIFVGFAVFNIIVARSLDLTKYAQGQNLFALMDVMKFGTMLVVANLLSAGRFDQAWLKAAAAMLAGLVVYDLGTYRVENHLPFAFGAVNQAIAFRDVLKFGTMLTVMRVAEQKPFNKQWMMSSLGYVAGLAVYDMWRYRNL